MDFYFSSFLTIFLSSSLFLVILIKLKTSSRKRFNLPPGPRRLPLIGHLHLFNSFRPPHRTMAELATKYGPLMHLKLGQVDTLVISSPEVAQEALTTHDLAFANRPVVFATEIITYKNTDLAFAPYGEYWRQLRKICTIELLSVKRVQSFRPIREEEFLDTCRSIASKAGSSINLSDKIEWATCNTFTRISLGKKTNEQETFIENFKEMADLVGGFYLPDLYPSIKVFWIFSSLRKRVERLQKISDRIIESIINDHKTVDPATKEREDLTDILLKFNEPGHELYLTTENIKAILMDMFSAGIESSSATIDWGMAEMLRQPKILKKAQDEVRQVFKDKGFVDESDFDKLNYLKLVIKETLRMHPPAPLLLPRESREYCKINGYEIPEKTRVLVNAWAMGRDPKCWKEPNSFIPERYLTNPVDYKGKNFEFIPFGAGRRTCPGMSFGLANVELPLAMLLYHFDWVLPAGMKPEEVNMEETFGITARREKPLYVTPIVKNPLPVA